MYKKNKEKNKTKLGKLCTLKKKTYTIFTFCQRLAGLGKPFLRTVTNALSSYYLQYVEGEKRMFTGSTRHKLNIFHVYIIKGWSVLVRVLSESGRINHSLVKEFIAFGAWTHLKLFCGRISCEEIGIDNIDVTTLVKSVRQFVERILTNDVFFNCCCPRTLRVKPRTLQHT